MQVQPAGGGGGGGRWHEDATAETEVSVSELEAHFRAQLEAAGWNLETGGSDERVAWSSWLVSRGDLVDVLGFLLVVAEPGRPYCWLRVYTRTTLARRPI